MKLDVEAAELRSLLDSPSPATITFHNDDGVAVTSPVWFQLAGSSFEFVIAESDPKLAHVRGDSRCLLLIFEAVPPFRGVQVRQTATVSRDEDSQARLAIAQRYLGAEAGRAYADPAARPPGWVVRLPVAAARAWSLNLPGGQNPLLAAGSGCE